MRLDDEARAAVFAKVDAAIADRVAAGDELARATRDEVRELGRACGYPECCIEAFVTERGGGQVRPCAEGADGEAVGHVMCADCAKRAGWELLGDAWQRHAPSVAAGYVKKATLKITTGQLVPCGGTSPLPTRIVLEGRDISDVVCGVTIRVAPGEITTATLEVYVEELDAETVAMIALATPQPKRRALS